MDKDVVELYDTFTELSKELSCRQIAELYRNDKEEEGGFEVTKLMNDCVTLRSKMFTVYITKGNGVNFIAVKKRHVF